MFQDIDGDIGGAYARVSLHPAGPHRKVAHPLSVGPVIVVVVVVRKDAEHRGAREAVKWHLGLGHALCSTSLLIDTLAKKKKQQKEQDTRQ